MIEVKCQKQTARKDASGEQLKEERSKLTCQGRQKEWGEKKEQEQKRKGV